MKSMYFFIFCLFFSLNTAFAQDPNKKILVAQQFATYQQAFDAAQDLSEKTKIRIDLRGLSYNNHIGLSVSPEDCRESGLIFPHYFPRGDYDDGVYISIEYSNAYQNLPNGKYLLVVASGNKINSSIDLTKKRIEKEYPSAQIFPLMLSTAH